MRVSTVVLSSHVGKPPNYTSATQSYADIAFPTLVLLLPHTSNRIFLLRASAATLNFNLTKNTAHIWLKNLTYVLKFVDPLLLSMPLLALAQESAPIPPTPAEQNAGKTNNTSQRRSSAQGSADNDKGRSRIDGKRKERRRRKRSATPQVKDMSLDPAVKGSLGASLIAQATGERILHGGGRRRGSRRDSFIGE